MTEQEREIERLMISPPTIVRTRGQKFWRAVSVTANVLSFVLLAAWIIATLRTSTLAACTNANLSDRNRIAQRDAYAHIDWAKAVRELLTTPEPARAAAFTALVDETRQYVQTLTGDQTFREAHPLGKC